MKVKELIELLQKQDPERLVVMSKDGEGNSFSPLASVGTASYSQDSGTIGLEPGELTDELREEGYCEDDILDGDPALVLWPA